MCVLASEWNNFLQHIFDKMAHFVYSGLARENVDVCVVSVREYVFYVFFSDFKKHDFLRFFEMAYQKS